MFKPPVLYERGMRVLVMLATGTRSTSPEEEDGREVVNREGACFGVDELLNT